MIHILHRISGNGDLLTPMVGFLGYHTAIRTLKDYYVINIRRRVCCGIGYITSAINNLAIPSSKSVGISVVSSSHRIGRNSDLIAPVVGFGSNHSSVPVLKYHGVINVCGRVCCGIGCIAHAINNGLIPIRKSVGISIIRGLLGFCRSDNLITIMIGLGGNYSAICIHKLYCIINISSVICSRISYVTCTIINLFIPTRKGISISVICLFSWIGWSGHFISIMISLGRNDGAVPILKHDSVINVCRCIGRSVNGISSTVNHCIVPTCKGIGISIIRCSCRIRGNRYSIAVMIGLGAEYIPVIILKHNSVININGSKHRCVGLVSANYRNILIPSSKNIIVCIIGRFRGIGRQSDNRT